MKGKSPQSYQFLIESKSRRQWERFGLGRRSGVAVPLFSVYSSRSIGIGEIPDLRLLVDWCVETGMSIIQLLPLNDVGFDFAPYDAQSMFALEPMYLSLEQLAEVDLKSFRSEIEDLRKRFPSDTGRVDYRIKAAKLDLLWRIFEAQPLQGMRRFEEYVKKNRYWLSDYALFKILKDKMAQRGWESWPEEFRLREKNALKEAEKNHARSLLFYEWLQWQLFEQLAGVRAYAAEKKVYLMGDLPFLVSRDSADVWSHQNYFKLERVAGAPPDGFFANGQRWGMPPYDWEAIRQNGFDYVIEKLRYAENFYDMFRIDHVVGIFRLWTIDGREPPEHGGINGSFDPSDETAWEAHGREILNVMVNNTEMLPCAEDLGVIPKCSGPVLQEFGVVGMDVQRWARLWETSYDFKAPGDYRRNSIAVVSTHDMSSLAGWWLYEVGTVDEIRFKRMCENHGIAFDRVKAGLFDEGRSRYGRLRWKKEICFPWQAAQILGRPEGEIPGLLAFYREAYDETEKFLAYLGLPQKHADKISKPLVKKILEKAGESASIFSVQLLQDWLSLGGYFVKNPWELRINFPGTLGPHNWSLKMPLPLEAMRGLEVNGEIKKINLKTERI